MMNVIGSPKITVDYDIVHKPTDKYLRQKQRTTFMLESNWGDQFWREAEAWAQLLGVPGKEITINIYNIKVST